MELVSEGFVFLASLPNPSSPSVVIARVLLDRLGDRLLYGVLISLAYFFIFLYLKKKLSLSKQPKLIIWTVACSVGIPILSNIVAFVLSIIVFLLSLLLSLVFYSELSLNLVGSNFFSAGVVFSPLFVVYAVSSALAFGSLYKERGRSLLINAIAFSLIQAISAYLLCFGCF